MGTKHNTLHAPAQATLRGAAGRSATRTTITRLNAPFFYYCFFKENSFLILLSLQALAFSVRRRLAGSPGSARPQAHS